MPLQASLEPFGGRVILPVQGFADGFQSLRTVPGKPDGDKVRMLRPLVRFSGPECDVVEGKTLVDRIAVHHRTQPSVAHGKGFFEEGGRAVIMKGLVTLRGA